MKIGITTFDGGPNYGSMLQAWALWHFLEAKGHEILFVNGGNSCLPVRYSLLACFISKNIRAYFQPTLYLANMKRKLFPRIIYAQFIDFADKYPRAKRYLGFNELCAYTEQFDCVIVGSDVVWRPSSWDNYYQHGTFLNWVKPGARRLSYAASFASRTWGSEHVSEMSSFLMDFDGISVREQSGVEIVKQLTGRNDVKFVIDPTLLLDAFEYAGIIESSRPQGKYVFSYFLHLTDWSIKESIDAICRSALAGVDVVDDKMLPEESLVDRILARYILKTRAKIPVPRWLNRIKNAEFMVTNSFHGMVFAIIFHTPFAVVLFDKNRVYADEGGNPVSSDGNERFVSLLTALELSERMVTVGESEKIKTLIHSTIDWTSVDEKLKMMKEDSRNWLLSKLTFC